MSDALKMTLLNWQGPPTGTSTAGFTLDDAAEACAFVMTAETGDAITDVGFRVVSRTGTPPTFVISVEALDGSGNPDGTALASATFTPPADNTWNSTWRWITLSSSWTPTKGQLFAIVIRYSSGTINGSNNMSFTTTLQPTTSAFMGFPYRATFTAATWTKNSAAGVGPFGYKTATGVFGCPAANIWSTNTTTAGHRQAAAITLPTTFGTTFKVSRIRAAIRNPAAATTYKVSIWDATGTELATSGTIDADHSATVAGDASIAVAMSTNPTLSFGTKYYYGLESISGSTIGVRGLTMSVATDRKAYPLGENRALATWNGSAWTEDTLTIPIVELELEDIDIPVASGGAIIIGGLGMTGVGRF